MIRTESNQMVWLALWAGAGSLSPHLY